jgi:hypothetical protein
LRNSDIVCERWFSGGDEVRIIAMDYKAELSVVVLDWMERKKILRNDEAISHQRLGTWVGRERRG